MTPVTLNRFTPQTLEIQQQVQVSFRYGVYFTQNLFHRQNPLLANVVSDADNPGPKNVVVFVDGGLLRCQPKLLEQMAAYMRHHSQSLRLAVAPVIVPGGEAAKNDPRLLTHLHQTLSNAGLCRHSYVLAIGGGAMLDLVGYAAATAHRGVRLVRIPTTVLAQNDSGVGVKNGVNAFGKKNFLGSFAPPYAVINDGLFLTTLDDRDWRSGVAEAIKVALIKDADFFHWIRGHAAAIAERNLTAMEQLIYRCAQLHLEHIATSGDPFGFGSSRPLDFGHWAAHRLEHLTHYELRHGEAVAIGIALDSTYSYLSGWLRHEEWHQILSTLHRLGFQLTTPELSMHLETANHPHSLFQGLQEFREHLGGELTLMLLQGIGRGKEVHQVQQWRYRLAIEELLRWQPHSPTPAVLPPLDKAESPA